MAKDKSEYYKEDGDEVTFNLVDKNTVEKLQKDGDINLPKKKISVPKDEAWNTKIMSSRLLQGILNGDSIGAIEKSLIDIIGTNRASLERNARTMTTGAECSGRIDSYKELESRGVVQKKVWMSTPDDRVRESHLEMDGEEVDINDTFSNGLMYPADPNGDPSEVWNCRCTMRTHIVGFRRADGSISEVNYERDTTLHDNQIEQIKEERKQDEKEDTNDKYTLKDVGAKPERPLKSDFTDENGEVDYEALHEAREKYHEELSEWQEKADKFKNESIPKAMPLADFEKWCDNKDIKIYGDISQVDERALRAYSERMDKLSSDFPEVMTYRENLEYLSKEFQKYEIAFENTTDFIAEATHGFTFGGRGVDINYLLSAQIDDVAMGYRVIGDGTLNQLFDHEFGHNVEAWITSKFERDEDGMFTKNGFEQYEEMKKDLLNNVYGKNGMSEYATTNENELFAEGFSAWYGGEQTEFAKSFGEFLERWM